MKAKKLFYIGILLVALFVRWTVLVQTVDVQAIGPNETEVGFASLNDRFHEWTGVHMALYVITDWLGLVAIFCCMCLGGIGLIQLVKRKNLLKVDSDLLILGIYYLTVIFGYLIFEMIPINYRPILINGMIEASYPSSTTLLVLSVMPTIIFQSKRRITNIFFRKCVIEFSFLFSVFMVIARTVDGVHWLTDILGAIFLSAGLYLIYVSCVLFFDGKSKK